MKRIGAVLLGWTALASTLQAANIATQVVTMSISSINELAITGSAPTLTINNATAGSLPNAAVSSGITWAYTTNNTATTGKTVTGAINTAMPANTQLTTNLAAPSGATSAGAVALTTTAQNLVTAIPVPSNQASLSLTYTFQQTAAVSSMASFTRTVTLTLTDS